MALRPMPHFRSARLCYYQQLGDARGLEGLLRTRLPSAQALELRNCWVAPPHLPALAAGLPRLRSLELFQCTGITAGAWCGWERGWVCAAQRAGAAVTQRRRVTCMSPPWCNKAVWQAPRQHQGPRQQHQQ